MDAPRPAIRALVDGLRGYCEIRMRRFPGM
ncbi:hypothetical protein ACVWZD_006923 [Streptomyces sp. TE3672]